MTPRKPPDQATAARPSGWAASLAASAAHARGDGGVSLMILLYQAGFMRDPAVTYVIRRERIAA